MGQADTSRGTETEGRPQAPRSLAFRQVQSLSSHRHETIYIRNTPKLPTCLRSSGRHDLLITPSESPSTVRVSEGKMMPSSQL